MPTRRSGNSVSQADYILRKILLLVINQVVTLLSTSCVVPFRHPSLETRSGFLRISRHASGVCYVPTFIYEVINNGGPDPPAQELAFMIPTPLSLVSAIPALASRHISSSLRNRSRLAALSAILAVLVCGAGSLASAQTAYFSGSQTALGSGFSDPAAVAVDSSGNVYVADALNNAVKEILAVNGSIPASPTIVTLGSGFSEPVGVAVDVNGDVFVSDAGNEQFKEILAVNGSIPASPVINILASTTDPGGIAVDSLGNVYVVAGTPRQYIGGPIIENSRASLANGSIRSAVSVGSSAIPSLSEGSVYEILAVNGSIPASPAIQLLSSGIPGNSPYSYPNCVAVDRSGNVYVTDDTNYITSQGINSVYEILAVNGSIPASTTVNVLASSFLNPVGVAVDGSGSVYVDDAENNSVKEVLAVNGSVPASPTVRTFGNDFNLPLGVAIDGTGNVYVADSGNNRVVTGSTSGANFRTVNIGTTNPPALALTFTFETAGTLANISVLTQGATGLDFANSGTGTCAANTAYATGQTCTVNVTFMPKFAGTRDGAVVFSDSNGNVIVTAYLQGVGVGPQINFLPGTESVVASSGLAKPTFVAVDGSRNVYIADTNANLIRKETLSGSTYTQSVLPTSVLTNPAGIAVDGSGNVYISDTDGNRVIKETPSAGGYAESLIANTANNGILNPNSIAVDGNGKVYFFAGDLQTEQTNVFVETPSAAGYIQSTVPFSGVQAFGDLAVDGNGNVYIADAGNNRVIEETPSASGYIQSTVPTSGLNQPVGIAVDGMGNIYVANIGGGPVFKETLTAGTYTQSTVSTRPLSEPVGLAVDAGGDIYIGDGENSLVLKEDLADPPSLTFASAVVGSTSYDSPQTVTVENVGNAPLSFPVPSSGSNPSIAANFTFNSSSASACPLIDSGASHAGMLAAGASCQLPISFTPVSTGSLGGSVTLTDNNLNAAAPGYSSQGITVSGTGALVAPSFTLIASPSSLTVAQGALGTSVITVAGVNGFNGSVNLIASGLPGGLAASFSSNPTTASSVLTFTASSSAATGTYNVTITGISPPFNASVTVVLTVNPTPGFTLCASPASLVEAQGGSVTSTITVNGFSGFAGNVNLAATGLPPNVTATFTPNPTAATSLLTLVAASSASPATATITITGTSGALTASTAVSLTINPVQVSAPPLVNFGAVNIGAASSATPLSFVFVNGGTLGSTAVLTQGATGLDFTNAGTGTCAPNVAYAPGQSCTINVIFKPTLSGARYGAAVVEDAYGNVISTGYVQGTGAGPQINFLPDTESTVASASSGLGTPYADAVDGSGNVYIADVNNNLVWKGTPSSGGYTLITIPTSSLNFPAGVAVDGGGNLYIVDNSNNRILEETPSPSGYNETVVADSPNNGISYPVAIAVDGSGNVYFIASGTVYEESPSAGSFIQTTIPTPGLNAPQGIAVDAIGNLYITDVSDLLVYKETLTNGAYTQTTIPMSGLLSPVGIAVDGGGNVYVTDVSANAIFKETPSGSSYVQSTVSSSQLNSPIGVAVDGSGNIYIADTSNTRVLKEDLADAPSLTFASTPAGATSTDSPQTITVENIGNAALTFSVPSTGTNPLIATNFTFNSSASSACPLVAAGSPAGTLPAGASCQLPISFTPTAAGALIGSLVLTDNNLNAAAPGYAAQNIALSGTGTQATPSITWATPAAITYGTPLTASQLNATTTVAGSFTYSPAAGTVLTAGQQTLTVTFTPTNTAAYTTATATVVLTVNQATPTITWAKPKAITYGTPLSATQLNATSTVAGTFTYSPGVGTILNAGTQTLTVTFTPTDSTDYATANRSVPLTVNKAALTVTWATPAAISYGTALSATQLDATSNAAGTYSYSPAAGTVLAVGNHTLTVTFTPTTPADYTTATATGSVTLTVNKATPTITWATPAAISYGTKLSGTQLDASASVAGTFAYSPASGTVLPVGNNTLKVTFTPSNTTDYTTATASVTLTVEKATPAITWATPKAITYGTALSATQLNASSAVAGTFKYSPASGTVLSAGSQTLSVTFTPTNTTDYTTATASVTLTVNKATPTISWATPKAITHGTPLSATQLDATSKVAGTFTYSPAAGTVLAVGNHTLTATFTPTNSTDYTTGTASVTLTVNK
jgi:sugar lactone lactonase YvrE